jgi:hypothetical protein
MMHVLLRCFDSAAGASASLPDRPDASVLNEAIPLFFIGRNRNGLWVVREAGRRAGGIFLFRKSAMRFAGERSLPEGCATMVLDKSFELDVENQGNRLVAWLGAALGMLARIIPAHPPAMPIRRKIFKGDWR